MRRVVLAVTMLPAGLTGIFGLAVGRRWDVGQVATVGTLYLAGAVVALIAIFLFERHRLEQEFQLKRHQLDFLLKVNVRHNQQPDRLAVGSPSGQRANVIHLRPSRPAKEPESSPGMSVGRLGSD
jgi:hypothetical protein